VGCAGAAQRAKPADKQLVTQEQEANRLFEDGKSMAAMGDYLRAEQYLVAAMERGFAVERAMPLLVLACVQSSRLRAVLTYVEPYLAERPHDWALREVLATVHLALGNSTDARKQLVKVIAHAPTRAEPHYLLAVLYRDQLHDPEAARVHADRYLALAPDSPRATDLDESLLAPEIAPSMPFKEGP